MGPPHPRLQLVGICFGIIGTLVAVGQVLRFRPIDDLLSLREQAKTEPLVGAKKNRHLVQTESCFGPEGRGGAPSLSFPNARVFTEKQMVQCEHKRGAPDRTYLFRLPDLDDDGKVKKFKGLFGIDQPEVSAITKASIIWKIRYHGRLLCELPLRNTQTDRCDSKPGIPIKAGAPIRVTQTMRDSVQDTVFAGVIEPKLGWSKPRPLSQWFGLVVAPVTAAIAIVLYWRRRRTVPRTP